MAISYISKIKISNETTLPIRDLNAAEKTHVHGNITNGGDITATAPTIANGDQVVINDHSASKITNGPTFDGSTTTKALTPKGTWETFLQTETDPTVPAWAKTTNKPTYSFSELTSHPTTLEGYGITDAYTKTEIDSKVSSVFKYKGNKTNYAALPTSGNTTGDVWHLTSDTTYPNAEFAWDGSAWQELGSTVDLSGYALASHTHYWANLSVSNAAAYNTQPEVANIKINGDTAASAASTANVTLVYNTTTAALDFVFA